MENNRKGEIRHSTPVEEIMGNPPSGMVRWGTVVFALILLLVIAASWFIRYPYIVYGNTVITTENPPVPLVARVSGRIESLLAEEGGKVRKGDVLAVMESAARYSSVLRLTERMDGFEMLAPESFAARDTSELLPEQPGLGELQEYYSRFRKSWSDYYNHIAIDQYGKKAAALKEEIEGIRRYRSRLFSTARLYEERLRLEHSKYLRDSTLFNRGVYSAEQFEISGQNRLKAAIELEQVRLDIATREIDISVRQRELQDIIATGDEERKNYQSSLEAAYLDLAARVDWWCRNYLLTSPIDGRVTLADIWGENQSVSEGDIVMTVIPEGEQKLVARVTVPSMGAGKVATGQRVNIRLAGYPYLEYGMIPGIVSGRSLTATENGFTAWVELPDSLVTFYGKQLDFTQNMPGTAEIITEDMRLLERVVYPFRYLAEKNRRASQR
ncbi:MAG: HlyD family secretion protein [Bacteroidales bacterium]|nr:HlyD family secretion protein [Bacteroidales bacterium]